MTDVPPAYLLKGKDETLLGTAVTELVHELVGDADRALVVEEFDGEEYDLSTVAASAGTPPFLTDRRVVVVRNLGRFTSDETRALSGYLATPLPSTVLVLATTAAVPKHLADALKAAGAVTRDTDPPSKARDRRAWFDDQVAQAGLRLDAAASALVLERLGEDVGRLASLLDTLAATFGPKARLGVDDVQPFLGEAGSVPPWDLTDAIDRGDTHEALVTLHRMLNAGDRHPLVVLAILHNHYSRMLRLDGAPVHDERRAAELLGGSPYQARKALEQVRRLGHDNLVRAFEILARADDDIKGARDLPPEVVIEVAVARLSRLVPRHR